MAAPALSIVELAEDDRTVILRANIAEGGDADLNNMVLADIANYAAVGPAAVALSIRRVWWSLENLSVDIKFEASTPVKALSLSGNGSYDFAAIHGVKNPGGEGSTGSILLDTYGIAINAALGCVGSLVIEFWKVRSGESGGELDSAATSSLFTPEVPEVSGGIIVGGNSSAAGYIQFLEDSDNGSNYVQVQAPASLAADYILTLPSETGTILTDTDIGVSVQAYEDGLTELNDIYTPVEDEVQAKFELREAANNGSSSVILQAPVALDADVTLTLPANDGDASQFLQTDGSGVLTWATVDTSLSNDTSPTLGGDLNLDTHKLYTSSDNKNIYIEPHGTGNVILTGCNLVLGDGQGIDFTANTNDETGAGSISSELLDDYETGTWTPSASGICSVSSYQNQYGVYTKIGNLVFIKGQIAWTGNNTGAANSYIGGVPFTTSTTPSSPEYLPQYIGISTSTNTTVAPLQLGLIGNELRVYVRSSIGEDTARTSSGWSPSGSSVVINFSGCYITG